MKNQVLFSSKDISKKLKYCLLKFLFGALRVKFTASHFGRALLIGSGTWGANIKLKLLPFVKLGEQ